MAKSSNGTFVEEIPKNEEIVLFAEDLVSDVMFRHSSKEDSLLKKILLKKNPLPLREYTYIAFNQITQSAILLLDGLNKNQDDSVSEMLKGMDLSPVSFKLFANNMEAECFAEGFGVKLFLVFCISISRMAASYYDLGITEAPELAKSHIVHILQKYDVISRGWATFHRKVAEGFANMQILNDDLLPENIDSEEIVYLNRRRAQYQASEDESNSSRSKTQNVLSENDRIELGQQEKMDVQINISDEIHPTSSTQ